MWEELYQQYYQELLRYGVHMTANKELTEELVQETFVRAIINTACLQNLTPSKQRAWLYRTFKNLFFDSYRHRALEQQYLQALPAEIPTEQGVEKMETELMLQSISPQDRQLFQLRYEDGYTAKEIAEMLNLPPGTVRSRLSRCRRRLKEIIDI